MAYIVMAYIVVDYIGRNYVVNGLYRPVRPLCDVSGIEVAAREIELNSGTRHQPVPCLRHECHLGAEHADSLLGEREDDAAHILDFKNVLDRHQPHLCCSS